MGSFKYVKGNGAMTTIPQTLTMKIDYNGIGCGKDESDLFPCESLLYIASYVASYVHKCDM